VSPATAPSTSAPPESARLVEFARACKGAARAVTLYPEGHPAIVATLKRIVALTAEDALTEPLALTITPEDVRVDGGGAPKAEVAIAELAALLHSHAIGRLTIHPGGTSQAWHRFLVLLGRDPVALREQGGFARAWAAAGGDHVEVREIDYAEALREHTGGESATWDRIVRNCLDGQSEAADDPAADALIETARDGEGIGALVAAVERAPEEKAGVDAKAGALIRALRRIVSGVPVEATDRLERVLRAAAASLEQLSPDVLLSLVGEAHGHDPALVDAVLNRMSDDNIARFVAHQVAANASTTRLAAAFRTLAPDRDHQEGLLALARNIAAESSLGKSSHFATLWNRTAEELIAEYGDESTGPDYGRQLSAARLRAIEIEEAGDDPPERIQAWKETVTTTVLRSLDLSLLLDLLRIDLDGSRWGTLMTPVVRLLEDLFLVGDFDAAQQLVAVLVEEAGQSQSERRSHATDAIELLIDGLMVRHLTAHLATIDEGHFDLAKAMCLSIGTVIVRPLAESLSIEDRPQTRERLTSILVAFGDRARKPLEQLRTSPNLAIRRTALYLLRELGGSDALPSPSDILGSDDAQVQREALRTIIRAGSEAGYRMLLGALSTARPRTRAAIVQSICGVRDEKVAPLLAHLVQHTSHRGAWTPIVIRAVDTLGTFRDPTAIATLRDVLNRKDWWAPRRIAAVRRAAAAALARIGTADAIQALETAAAEGSRSVQAAARPHLEQIRAPRAPVAEGRV
jgi:HEAT repeat protein